ncbi:MAG: hypothetical protein EOP83_28560 [Verrucomicrobiaceae bacterium]|nr:MAG: hypothetical protein EOP83_28560 [Verrucomicrobiaceae bacterium]
MKLFELDQNDVSTGYYDPNEDKINGRALGDTRKPKITLRKINRLKKMRALRQLESLKRQDLLAVMYGVPEDDGGGMGGGGGFPM